MIYTSRFALTIRRCGSGLARHLSSMLQTNQLVLAESIDHGIHVLTLNNEKRANCLSLAMIHDLHAAIKKVKEMDEVHALIIHGAGRFFSAGHDLNEFVKGGDPKLPGAVFTACANMMIDLANLPVISIAAVCGPAHATGCQLVATCDLAVAGQSATFATATVKFGLFCSTPAVALVRAIGLRAAKELLFTGCTIDASRARELGLVNLVVPDDQLFESTLELARKVAQHSKPVMAMGKRALYAQADLNLKEAYTVATQVMLENLELEDTQRGIAAFINKQPIPQWTHKKD